MSLRRMMFFAGFIGLLFVTEYLFGQYGRHNDKEQTSYLVAFREKEVVPSTDIDRIFDAVEKGIVSANMKLFSQYFAKQVSLNLSNHENAYYSANQSYYILQNYFDSRKVLSFKLSLVNTTDSSPYATGGGRLRARGSADVFQVYVSLTNDGGRWVISQFNVY